MSKTLRHKTRHKTVEKLFSQNAIEVQVGKESLQFSVEELYENLPDRFTEIKTAIEDHCKGQTPEYVERYLADAQRVFEERAFAKARYENVLKEELRIRRQELNPHEFSLDAFEAQAGRKADLISEEHAGYRPSSNGFDSPNDPSPRRSGATQQEFEDIMDDRASAPFFASPNKYYRNSVFDAEVPARDAIRVNNKRLEVFLGEGRTMLTSQEEGECRRHSEVMHQLSNELQYFEAGGLNLAKTLGRGVISKTNAEETSDYKKYSDQRNDTVYDMLYKACPREHRGAYFHALKQRNAVLRSRGNPHSIAMADEMDRHLDEMLTKYEDEDRRRREKLEKDIEAGNKQTLTGSGGSDKGLQGYVEQEDEMRKWTMLYAFMVLGPFAGGIAVAPILANLLGPVLAGSGSFAQGVAALPTNSLFGPFGKLVELCHFPDAIEWVMGNVPVIEQLNEIMEFATRNEISAGILEQMLPLASSPITALGIAALAGTAGVSQEYLLSSDKKDFMKKKTESLESLSKAYEVTDEIKQKERSKEFAQRSIEAQKEAIRLRKFAEFLAREDDATLSALEIEFSDDEFSKIVPRNPENVVRFLLKEKSANPRSFKENFNKFLLFEYAESELARLGAMSESEKQEAIIKQTQNLNKECVFGIAAMLGVEGLSTNSEEENVRFLESKLLSLELERLNRDGVSFNEARQKTQKPASYPTPDRKKTKRFLEFSKTNSKTNIDEPKSVGVLSV